MFHHLEALPRSPRGLACVSTSYSVVIYWSKTPAPPTIAIKPDGYIVAEGDEAMTAQILGYALAGDYDIEVYLPPEEGSGDMKVYIWVPLKKA